MKGEREASDVRDWRLSVISLLRADLVGGGRGRGTCVTPVGESNREGVMNWLWEKSRLRPGVSDSITCATPRGELNRAVVWGGTGMKHLRHLEGNRTVVVR